MTKLIGALLPLCALMAAPTALASDGQTELFVGVGYPPGDRDPASIRFGLRGAFTIAESEAVGLSAVLPLEFDTTGNDGFGFSTRTTYGVLAPSLRATIAPELVVSPYVDVGIGPALRLTQVDSVFGGGEDSQLGWSLRSTAGVRIGEAGEPGPKLLIEPIGVMKTRFGDTDLTRLSAHAGFAWTF